MTSRKMLITMYEYSYFLVGQNIKEINHQDSLISTPGSSNAANWILGHIITSRCNVLAMLKIDPPWDFQRCKPYIPDSEPIKDGDEVEDFVIMKEDLEKTQDLLLEAIRTLTDQALEEKRGDNSLGEELAGYAVHEAYHAGGLGMIKQQLDI